MSPLTDQTPLLERLEGDGLLRREGDHWRTTRRWQAAMARSAWRLLCAGDQGEDLRVPIALALVERYGDELQDEALARAVEALVPIESRELCPRAEEP